MMRLMRYIGLLAAAGLLLGGCATVSREAAFEDVQADVSERTNTSVHWRQGTPEDEKVDQQVRALLAAELTADAAVQVALLNNPRLQARYEELGLAQASLVQAGLLSNPVFHGAVLYEGSGGSPDMIDAGISLSFLDVLMVPMRRQLAEAEFETAKLRMTAAVMDLAAEVRSAFYRLQAEAQRVDMFERIVAGMDAAHDFARRLHEVGNITGLAYAGERAAYESARVDLAAAQSAVTAARERLNVLMGLWGADTQWTVAPRLPDLPGEPADIEAIEKRAVERSLDLAIARGSIERAARRLGITDSTRIVADLEIGLAAEREGDGHWTRGPSVGFNIPIFDVGQGRLAAAQAGMRRSQQEYLATAIEVRSAARRAAYAVESARLRTAHLKDVVVPLRSRIMAESMLHYNAMQLGLPQLLIARQQEIDAGRRYIDALRDYWLARGELEQILNGRVVDTGGTMPAAAPVAGMQAESGGH